MSEMPNITYCCTCGRWKSNADHERGYCAEKCCYTTWDECCKEWEIIWADPDLPDEYLQ